MNTMGKEHIERVASLKDKKAYIKTEGKEREIWVKKQIIFSTFPHKPWTEVGSRQ